MTHEKRIGMVQSRGLGDLVIALPIADYYYQQGYQVHWPICEEFISHMIHAAPWVHWIPVVTDTAGDFFWNTPTKLLADRGITEVICLYQALSSHPEFSQVPYFQITSFDQYKYVVAGVPFVNKWKLNQCVVRDHARERALYDRLVVNSNYVVVHDQGSDFAVDIDLSMVPADWQIIKISNLTDSVWDWLKILDNAQCLVLVDSVFANMVDQLGIGDDNYFVQRSHMGLTPVLGNQWTYL